MATETLEVPQNLDDPESDGPPQLFRHSKRPEWGMAILVWEKKSRRAYQFEDGKLRKIQKGYYKLLNPVEDYDGPADAVRTNLRAAVKARRAGSSQKIQKPVCAFEEQISLFIRMYPKGFQDPEWISDHRGREGGSALKRHREPSLKAAKEVLDPSSAKDLLDEGRGAELAESILDVLAGTNLVPISHVKNVRELDEDDLADYAETAFNAVHGEGPFDQHLREHFNTLERLLGKRPSWRSATALTALVHPQEHVAVRRSAFLRQAGSIAPTGNYSRKPKVASYKSFCRVARDVKKRLEGQGHKPADLLDIHDFVWATLRKSALDKLKGGGR